MKIYPLAIITFLLAFSLQTFAYTTPGEAIRIHYINHTPIFINNNMDPVIYNGEVGKVRVDIVGGIGDYINADTEELPQPIDLPSNYSCVGLLANKDGNVRMAVTIYFLNPDQTYRSIYFYFDLKDIMESGSRDTIATSTDGLYSVRIYGSTSKIKLLIPSSVIHNLGYTVNNNDREKFINTYIIKGVNRFKRVDGMATLP